MYTLQLLHGLQGIRGTLIITQSFFKQEVLAASYNKTNPKLTLPVFFGNLQQSCIPYAYPVPYLKQNRLVFAYAINFDCLTLLGEGQRGGLVGKTGYSVMVHKFCSRQICWPHEYQSAKFNQFEPFTRSSVL